MFIDLSVEGNRIEVLQKILRYLSFVWDESALRITVSGDYNEATADAVRRFQSIVGLSVTGVTDPATWTKLVEAYNIENQKRIPVIIRPIPNEPDYVTEFAERSDTVLILQIMLRALALRYDYLELPPLSGVYGSKTADAVRYFQEINGLEITGRANVETLRRMSEEYNMLVEQ